MKFFEPMRVPTATAQERGVDWRRRRFYDKPEWAAAKDTWTAHMERHRPDAPAERGVIFSVVFCFPLDGHADGEPHVGKPDTDNLVKGLKDVLTRLGYWKDDRQVFSEHVTKIHSRVEGVEIEITEI